MSRMQLPECWWYSLNMHGEGHAILPPLKIKPVLTWTAKHLMYKDGKLEQSSQMPIEKISIELLRRPCNINNL